MKRRMLFLVLTVVGALPVLCLGQEGEFIRRYATQDYMKGLMAAHPEMIDLRSAIERQVAEYRQKAVFDTLAIAVVFHLVGAAAESIGPDDIAAQMASLNEVFYLPIQPEAEGLNEAWTLEGFSERAAKPAIQFCLANQDPSGNPSDGYHYIATVAASFPIGEAVATTEGCGAPAWDPNQYLNVWVAQLDNHLAGFAQMPGGPLATDGVVIHADFFARKDTVAFVSQYPQMANYLKGRTLAHLIGSYLNLYELWNNDLPCSDDYVEDTPIHNAPNQGKPSYRHLSTCEDNPIEMTMNIMDNTDDSEQFMFTNGQLLRMYATLAENGPRSGLRKNTGQCTDVEAKQSQSRDRHLNEDKLEIARNEETLLEVFPNPANDGFSIRVKTNCGNQLRMEVFDQLGKQFFQKPLKGMEGHTVEIIERIDTRSWPSGIYKVQLSCGAELQSTTLLLGH